MEQQIPLGSHVTKTRYAHQHTTASVHNPSVTEAKSYYIMKI